MSTQLPFERPPFDHPAIQEAKEREAFFDKLTIFGGTVAVIAAATLTYRSWWHYKNGKPGGIFDETKKLD